MRCIKFPAFCHRKPIALAIGVLATIAANAKDGDVGSNQANTMVKGCVDTVTTLLYAISAVVGLIGVVTVFAKWNLDKPDTTKIAATWFGFSSFLSIVATFLKAFFYA